MYYSEDIINKIGADESLAIKLDKAMTGVKDGFIDYVNNIGDGATRLLYYTSCFTDNYEDVCNRLSIEDRRFFVGAHELVKNKNVIFRMVKIYVETILKNKSESEIKIIYEQVVPITKKFAVSQFSKLALVYAVVKFICYGNTMNAAIQNAFIKKTAGRTTAGLLVLGAYGIIQHASESANNLKYFLPQFYNALYVEKLEMMYFLIEPLVMRGGYLNISTASNTDIINVFRKMAGQ